MKRQHSNDYGSRDSNSSNLQLMMQKVSLGLDTDRLKSQESFTKYPKNYKDALELYKDDEPDEVEIYPLSARYS